MKVTDKMLSLPPYISTSWKNIISLQVDSRPYGPVLVIELMTGNKVEVPNLDVKTIEKIFSTHAEVMDQEANSSKTALQSFAFPLPIIEGIPSLLQHNLEQANTPPLPPEMLEKITLMTKGLIPDDLTNLPKPEPHCNCPHCQIMRALSGTTEIPPSIEEDVSDEDLKFRTWDIKQEGEKLFSVTNPLDQKEHYTVFLGEPIGCTCGNNNCVHIQTVLRS